MIKVATGGSYSTSNLKKSCVVKFINSCHAHINPVFGSYTALKYVSFPTFRRFLLPPSSRRSVLSVALAHTVHFHRLKSPAIGSMYISGLYATILQFDYVFIFPAIYKSGLYVPPENLDLRCLYNQSTTPKEHHPYCFYL
jgi:hypothetical protein